METTKEKALSKLEKSDKRYKIAMVLTGMVICAVALVGTVSTWVILNNQRHVIESLEDTQKANSCVALLEKVHKTKENIAKCVENNKSRGGDNFDFKDVDDNNVTPDDTSNSITIQEAPAKASPIVIDEKPPKPPEEPKPTKDPPRVIERSIDALNQSICRVVGTQTWILGDCE